MIKNLDALPVTLTIPQLMDVLNIGRNTAYQLIHSGKIRSVRIGRQLRIPKDSVRDFLFTDAVS